MAAKTFIFEHLQHEESWISPARVAVDGHGMITRIEAANTHKDADLIKGLTIAGMANLHSHAFQRAMVGLSEFADASRVDSFWTWREQMYRLAASMSPDDLEAVAAQLYVEMLQAGMTAVGEFHYLHHDVGGQRFSNPCEMSARISAAADSTGIILSHLPVLYLKGGFGQPPTDAQARFVHCDVDEFLRFHQSLESLIASREHDRLGVAPHSLRAVDTESLATLIANLPSDAPIHIHIAEQKQEVEEAVAYLGERPVKWLLHQYDVDQRWCLVHATHQTDEEVTALAKSGAVVGLCPSTEANLGDGIFPARKYLDAKGLIGIGTDSQVNVSIAAELRLLEYGQRLRDQQRNVLASITQPSVGRRLIEEAQRGGAQALAQPMGKIEVGRRADFVVLDNNHPRLAEHSLDTVLDAWIFGHAESAVKQVMVAGKWLVKEGRHIRAEEIFQRFRRALQGLMP
jgi:formimidoylglutamate deiminase